ncbi:MAG: crotonobetainyl-CoA:carnitine CoA-transferase CaiB-like acyl-CoA transferase [Candidatus Azotimanducaceae bacterium]
MNSNNSPRPLDGITVIEVGQLLAGPWAGTMLAYFGAEVIKVEPPGEGDPIRGWRILDETGTAYWWRSLARNKKSVTANLRTDDGREVVRRLMNSADVVIENFKPGTMEKWGLGPDDLATENPDLIFARISGYGQTGPNATKPGYASVTEAYSGFRYVNGFPGEVPVRPNLSIGDTISGIHAFMGILLALLERGQNRDTGGQVVDVALYEAMYNLMEGMVPEYSGGGEIREPSGSTITGIVPTNTYLCGDGKHVVIGANGDSIFTRLMNAMDKPEIAADGRYATNAGRVEHQDFIDGSIAIWTKARPADEVISLLEAAEVPVGPIYNVADMMADPHFRARGLFEEVTVNGATMEIPAISPKLSATPGKTDWPGGELGSHTDEILQRTGFTPAEIDALRAKGAV